MNDTRTWQFAEISFWWLLLAPALAYLLLRAGRRKQLESIGTFLDLSLITSMLPGFKALDRQYLKFLTLFSLGLFFIAISLLQPQWGFEIRKTNTKGVDIVVAVDVSDSMRATDVSPNRLTRAKREIGDLVQQLKGDRIALVTFAGTAFLESPLTQDYGAYRMFLGAIDPQLIPIKGTNISAALEASLDAFSRLGQSLENSSRSRALVLITDGEDFEGDFETIAQRAKDESVLIYVLGVGTAKGSTIPTRRGNKIDSSGKLVISKLNESALRELAKATGGTYISSIGSDSDSYALYEQGIRKDLDAKKIVSGTQRKWNEYFQLPLAIGIFLLMYSWNIPFSAGVLALALFVPLSPQIASADYDSALAVEAAAAYMNGKFSEATNGFKAAAMEDEKNYKYKSALAASLYRQGQFQEAASSYLRAGLLSKEVNEKAKALYNAGNSLAQLNDLEGAIEAYEESLKLIPKDEDTISNLEYVKKLLQQQEEEQKEQQQQNEEEKQKEQEKEQQSKDGKEQGESQSEKQKEGSNEEDKQEEREQEEKEQEGGEKQDENDSEKGSDPKGTEDSRSNSEGEEGAEQEHISQSEKEIAEQKRLQEELEKKLQEAEGEKESKEATAASMATKGEEETPKERKDQLEAQLGNIEEGTSKRMKYRMRKGLEQLRKMKQRPSVQDW